MIRKYADWLDLELFENVTLKEIQKLDIQDVLTKLYPYRHERLQVIPELIKRIRDDYGYDAPDGWFTPADPKTFMDFFQRELTDEKKKDIQSNLTRFVFPCECEVESIGNLSDTSSIIRLKSPSSSVRKSLEDLGVKNVEKLSFINCKLLLAFYHRIHSPVEGIVKKITSVSKEEDLFGNNTLTIIELKTPDHGRVYMLLVGELKIQDFETELKVRDTVKPFQEIGKFDWGSQCVILYESSEWTVNVSPGQKYFVGDTVI